MINIPGFQDLEKLYESETTIVFRASQIPPQKRVILKLLRNTYPTIKEMAALKREFEIGSKLKSHGVVESYRLEKYQNSLMIVQEDFGGTSLDVVLPTRKPSLLEILNLSVRMADAVGHIHRHNVIHKDINPSNIVWNPTTNQLKIIDFGLSSELPRETQEIRDPNVLEGTLAYMSPEQTGRMNRAMDYRTDLYSLGVVLYQMTTGALPFAAADPLELIHCHIARTPASLTDIMAGIPMVVSDIILKLLSKNAEDRYQSAYGLKSDLQQCADRLQSAGSIAPFDIGRQDVSDKFQVPQKLYGRRQEIQTLLKAFDHVCRGEKTLLTVSGLPGIGKSVIVNEIQKPVVSQRGFFVSGKFDQLERDIPYRALIQAFRQLIEQILTESEPHVADWKEAMANALGPNGRAMTDIFPELELLMGFQPELPPLPPVEAQNRFNLVFQKFIGVFAKEETPLVLFLDDLQWADAASLKLIEMLMANKTLQFLFLLGAYRENEVKTGHPLMLTLEALRKTGTSPLSLHIQPLPLSDVQQLVADTVSASTDRTSPLAEAVYVRTQGNPFFTIQLLKSFYETGVIFYNAEIGKWQWQTDDIDPSTLPSDVVDLMADTINRLPLETGDVLKLAACIGNRFDLKMLTIICQRTPLDTGKALWPAMQEGLVLPIGGDYKLLQNLESWTADTGQATWESISYRFLHDRVQQAAYALIPEDQKKRTHLEIGRLLLKDLRGGERDEKIFDIVNQINYALDLLDDSAERELLADLNLKAGQRAIAANAYESALNYLDNGRRLLSEAHWNIAYDLMLNLHMEAANAAYLCGRFSDMEKTVQTGIRHAAQKNDTVPFYEALIQSHFSRNRPLDVLTVGLRILQQLGCPFPKSPNDLHALIEILRIKWMMRGKHITDLYHSVDVQDLQVKSLCRILPHLGASAYRTRPKLLSLAVLKGVQLFLRHGNAAESSFFIAAYGMILCGALGNIDVGFRFGELAFALKERPIGRRFKARTWVLVEGFIRHWQRHIKESLEVFLEIYRLGLETGDLEFGTTAAHLYCSYGYFSGRPLNDLLPDTTEYSRIIAHYKQETVLNYNEVLRQAVTNLVEPTPDPARLAGKAYNEEEMLALHHEARDHTALFVVYLHKLILACLFESWDQAVTHAETLAHYMDSAVGLFYTPVGFYYEAIARLADLPNLPGAKQKAYWKRIARIRKKMNLWATHAPMNHRHRYLLVDAEIKRAEKHYAEAADLYDQAIRQARENGFIQDESLALERFAAYWFERNKPEVAQVYLHKAYFAYRHWGAKQKLKDLEVRYPDGLTDVRSVSAPMDGAMETSSLGESLSAALDINTVVKASQSISSEIALGRMLSNLIRILIENAGAQKGMLILEKSGELFIEAEGTLDTTRVLESIPIQPAGAASRGKLPETIVQYVARTKAPLVLDNATDDQRFVKDPYILNHAVTSVLCMPVIRRGRLDGILYLENNLTRGAFTPERLALLKLLASQAAISMENARLYATLEEKIEARTRELAEAQDKIIRLEKEATEIQMAGGFAHEMRNALAGAQKLIGKAFDDGQGTQTTLCYQNAQKLTDIYLLMKEYLGSPQLEEMADLISGINENEATLDEILRRSRKRLGRALDIVDEIMEYSKIGTSQPGDARVSLGQIIETIVADESKEEFEELGIRIHADIDTSKSLIGDERHFYSILKNMLLNARDALIPISDDQRKRIDIRLENHGVSQVLIIKDFGIGMDEDVRNKVFNPFFTTKPHSGTGLGLGVVAKLVGLYNGAIRVESRPNQGTTFIIEFPYSSENSKE